ncbi:RNA dependent RNA polymerase-domain-containing protein [Gymnopilus junonius]|uniref:RNA-dependent RNA polymerase n=1 Tax=Gymnopilus junonius TaxID=109634 RepID=A0A9P5P1Q5_GYMJU|nr:RNA dependent RNA polymerase-domain-containing protein [Gymnopilus junonius]
MQASSSKNAGLRHMLEEELEENGEGIDDAPLQLIDFKINQSTDSLRSLSQHSSYSHFGDDDLTDAILAFNPTQEAASEEQPPSSTLSSENSLGKRKASDIMSTSSNSPFRPPKIPKCIPGEDNVFATKFCKEEIPNESDNIYSPICISPPHHFQRLFDAKDLPYGAQYEIARYISSDKMKYSDILIPNVHELAKLKSNREAVPAIAQTILKNVVIDKDDFKIDDASVGVFAKEYASKSPWLELDREEEALKKDPLSGLGFNEAGEYQNWYGGQVIFSGKLHDASARGEKLPKYKTTLEPAELGPSYMFARRFGSKNFFRLKLTKLVQNTKKPESLLGYLCRPMILCGGVFRAFYAKESNVFYVKTNEYAIGERILQGETIPGMMSFLEFLEWHNPMACNDGQTMAKYVSRFALGLSNSVPGLMVAQSDIHFIDDIISEQGSNMTDGAGKINLWSLKQIRHRLGWEDTPSAIQTRIFGTKGLLVNERGNPEECAIVWVTPSQRKIQFPGGTSIDRAHRIIDVLRSSHTKSPCRLSVETIMCLADNGVTKKVFLDLLHKGLEELVKPLLDWDSPDSMRELWCNVRRLGGVMAARRAREEAGRARVKGYSEREAEEIEIEDEDGFTVDITENQSVAWWSDEISGCPSSLEETIMYMLDSGFTPQECPVLRDKLHKFIKGRIQNYIKSYRIDVPMSASAFLVPDTLSILKPGEVFFKSSRRIFLLPDGTESDIFIGDVLVTRHPCKLPTDIQKWKSVDRPELHHLTDVIILPTTGDRRAADMLAGGDHDGDKGIFTWQPEIVQSFQNAPDHFSEPPSDINLNFARENLGVAEYITQTESVSNTEEKIRGLQKYLLGAICNTTVVGKYSNFHEIAIYTLGYRHPETIRLAYMFCMTLDGVKTGMTVLPSVLRTDTQKFQKRPPAWKEATEDRERSDMSNEANVKRPSALGRFIMDELYKQASSEGDHWLADVEKFFQLKGPCKEDEHLSAPWLKALKKAEQWQEQEHNFRMTQELEKIRCHVEQVYNEHRNELSSPRKPSRTSPKKSGPSFTDLPIEVRQDKIRQLSKKFTSFPPPDEFLTSEQDIASIRASYAYVYDLKQRERFSSSNFTRFPFDVAMRELAAIKARARGRFKAVDGDFYDHFNMKHMKKHHF